MQDGSRTRRVPRRLLLRLAGRHTEPQTKPMPAAHEGVMALASAGKTDLGWWVEAVGQGH